jgi:hypothetical protein
MLYEIKRQDFAKASQRTDLNSALTRGITQDWDEFMNRLKNTTKPLVTKANSTANKKEE